ncbi:MAG TPA: alpha/beta fold hydrolase [Candidatus Acidoferrales bacterium]|nr:alpha/beta fold hydrolase [Candidatus Acidoferrales bacterium]
MPYLDRDGVKIYYEERGTGPAILLSHGYSASARMWQGQLDALSDSYRLIAWDMRGHDRSDSPENPALYSHDATVADMAAILDACRVDRAVIGGLSLGGFMSLAFHLAHPARTLALMLFDTGPGYKRDEPRQAWNRMAESTAVAYETQGLTAAGTSAEVTLARHRSAKGLALASRGMLSQTDGRVIESLPGISVPTLVLVGADDAQFLPSAEYMAAKIPHAEKVVLAGAGHAANIDQPAAFNSAVRSFLQRVTH